MASTARPRSHEDFKQEFLTCSLCANPYDSDDREPKCLPCLHCFCKLCLRRHIAGKVDVQCPNCRKNFMVPEGGVDSFATNFNVENLREYQNLHQDARMLPENVDGHLCSSCDDGHAATGYCRECEFVCHKCTEMHKSMRGLRSHEIEPLDALPKPEEELKRRRTSDRCRAHNKLYSMYCRNCKKPICDTCGQIIDHSNHAKVDLNNAMSETIQVIKGLSNTVRNKKEPLENLSAKIDTRINDINAVFAKQEEEIDAIFKQLEKRLRERCTQAKKELQDRCQVLNKLLQEQKSDVEAIVAQYDSACNFADQTCENASPKQLFKHEEMVRKRIL